MLIDKDVSLLMTWKEHVSISNEGKFRLLSTILIGPFKICIFMLDDDYQAVLRLLPNTDYGNNRSPDLGMFGEKIMVHLL